MSLVVQAEQQQQKNIVCEVGGSESHHVFQQITLRDLKIMRKIGNELQGRGKVNCGDYQTATHFTNV